MRKEKTWYILGAILGIAVIILGIFFCATPAEAFDTQNTDPASFGGDFYTYQYSATRAAASNAAVTANNLRELGEKMATYVGFAFIVAGSQILLHNGRAYFCQSSSDSEQPSHDPFETPEAHARPAMSAEQDELN